MLCYWDTHCIACEARVSTAVMNAKLISHWHAVFALYGVEAIETYMVSHYEFD